MKRHKRSLALLSGYFDNLPAKGLPTGGATGRFKRALKQIMNSSRRVVKNRAIRFVFVEGDMDAYIFGTFELVIF